MATDFTPWLINQPNSERTLMDRLKPKTPFISRKSVNGVDAGAPKPPATPVSPYGPVGPNSFMSGAGVPLDPAKVPTYAGTPVAKPSAPKSSGSSGKSGGSVSGSGGGTASAQMSAPVEPTPPPPDPWATMQGDYEGYLGSVYGNARDAIAARATNQNAEWDRLRARLDSDYNTVAQQMETDKQARLGARNAMAARMGVDPNVMAQDADVMQWDQQDARLASLNQMLKTGGLGSLDVLNQARKSSMEQYLPMLEGTQAAQIASFAAAMQAMKQQAEAGVLAAKSGGGGGGGGGGRRGYGGGGGSSGGNTSWTSTLQDILGTSSEESINSNNTAMWNAFLSTLSPSDRAGLDRLSGRVTSDRGLSNVAQEARDTYKPISGNELNRMLKSSSRNTAGRQQQAAAGEYFAAGKYLPAAPYLEGWYGAPKVSTSTKTTGSNKGTNTITSKGKTTNKAV